MFKVQPVRSRELQSEIAKLLNCSYYENTYAFFAGELNDDCSEITAIIALCQFELSPECAVIKSLSYAPGCGEDEAVMILLRTVMNFIYRAEVPSVVFDDGAADSEFIKKAGFRPDADGKPFVDLKKFYRSPCHYNADEE